MLTGIWRDAYLGDLAEVERLVGQDPGLLNARDRLGMTPLMLASESGQVEVVAWLLDKGAAINERHCQGCTALSFASSDGRLSAVRLLMERGADPTIATDKGSPPLLVASSQGHLEVVRVLLDHPSSEAIINHRNHNGETALWRACFWGRWGVGRALLESGADPAIASNDGTTPTTIAKQAPPYSSICPRGRRWCAALLEVSTWGVYLVVTGVSFSTSSEARRERISSSLPPLSTCFSHRVAEGDDNLPVVQGSARRRRARKRRGGGGGGAGGGGEGGAGGLGGQLSDERLVHRADGLHGLRWESWICLLRCGERDHDHA
jgi:hypothetical protein